MVGNRATALIRRTHPKESDKLDKAGWDGQERHCWIKLGKASFLLVLSLPPYGKGISRIFSLNVFARRALHIAIRLGICPRLLKKAYRRSSFDAKGSVCLN